MKGNQKVIETLNDLLRDELTGINQYVVHAEMCSAWGYKKLHDESQKRAIVEMKHAEKLIGRILFLEGTPIVSELSKLHIGADVATQVENDRASEDAAVKAYNAAIRLCAEVGDHGTGEMLVEFLKAEEAHLDRLEAQLSLIQQLGIQSYLVEQLD